MGEVNSTGKKSRSWEGAFTFHIIKIFMKCLLGEIGSNQGHHYYDATRYDPTLDKRPTKVLLKKIYKHEID
jgi:hypothetical protein